MIVPSSAVVAFIGRFAALSKRSELRAQETYAHTDVPGTGGYVMSSPLHDSVALKHLRVLVDAVSIFCLGDRFPQRSEAAVKIEWLLASRCRHVEVKIRGIMRPPVGRVVRCTNLQISFMSIPRLMQAPDTIKMTGSSFRALSEVRLQLGESVR